MKKKPTSRLVTVMAITMIISNACKKNDVAQGGLVIQEQPIIGFIDSAKKYFDETVLKKAPTTSTDKNTTKTPVWDKAIIKVHADKQVVIVPLKFEGNVTYKSNHLEGYTLPADHQTKLVIFRDREGRFQNRLYTSIPNEEYLAKKTKDYSGLLLIEDWQGNNRNSYIASSGKFRELSVASTESGPSTESVNSTTPNGYSCYYLNIYYCYYDEFCYKEDCTFLESKFLGCFQDQDETLNYLDNADGAPLVNTEVDNTEIPIGRVLSEKVSISICENTDYYIKKCYKWRVYEISGGSFLPCRLVSKEVAKLVRDQSGYKWQFSTFDHERIVIDGYTLGYEVSVSNEKGTASFFPANGLPRQDVSMYLDFQVTISVKIEDRPYAVHRNPSTKQSWNVNEL